MGPADDHQTLSHAAGLYRVTQEGKTLDSPRKVSAKAAADLLIREFAQLELCVDEVRWAVTLATKCIDSGSLGRAQVHLAFATKIINKVRPVNAEEAERNKPQVHDGNRT